MLEWTDYSGPDELTKSERWPWSYVGDQGSANETPTQAMHRHREESVIEAEMRDQMER